MLSDQENRDFHSTVAMPAYWEFCREHKLNFPCLAVPPEKIRGADISYPELKLHEEGMMLFNHFHARSCVFRNHVVDLNLSVYKTEFGYRSEPIDEFFRKHFALEERFAKIEKQYNWFCLAFGVIGYFSFIVLLALLLPLWMQNSLGFGVVGFSMIGIWIFGKSYFRRRREERQWQEEKEILKRLHRLRERIEEHNAKAAKHGNASARLRR